MKFVRVATAALALWAAGCSEIPDQAAAQGFAAIDGAYASDVKPADASYTQCRYGLADSRHVVRCGISYGGPELAQVGYWEIESQGEAFVVFAMNGKALTALDRITRPGSLSSTAYPGAFQSGQGRAPLDMPKVNESFK